MICVGGGGSSPRFGILVIQTGRPHRSLWLFRRQHGPCDAAIAYAERPEHEGTPYELVIELKDELVIQGPVIVGECTADVIVLEADGQRVWFATKYIVAAFIEWARRS